MRTIGVASWWSADFRFERGDTQQRGTEIVGDVQHGWHVIERPALRRPPIDMGAVRASMGLFRA